MKDESDRNVTTVFYDGACPTCVRDRRWYESLLRNKNTVVWCDITNKDDELRKLGIEPYKALTELHIKDEQNRIWSEIDAYVVLMKKIPVLAWLAWLLDKPGIHFVASKLYRYWVKRRLIREKRY